MKSQGSSLESSLENFFSAANIKAEMKENLAKIRVHAKDNQMIQGNARSKCVGSKYN